MDLGGPPGGPKGPSGLGWMCRGSGEEVGGSMSGWGMPGNCPSGPKPVTHKNDNNISHRTHMK